MVNLRQAAVLAAGFAVLGGCARSEAPVADTAADQAAMRAGTAAWVAAFNAGDVDKIVALYTEDAVVMPPDSVSLTGHEAIRKYSVASTAESKAAGMSFALDAEASGACGDLGWHSGTFHVTDAKGGSAGTGKYAEVWRRSGGKWLIIRDIWNMDPAPAAAAAAPAPAPAAAKKK
jgi:uncharacterized protein (TIGR02246 family)